MSGGSCFHCIRACVVKTDIKAFSQYHTSEVCRRELTEALLYHNCSPSSTKGILVSGISAERIHLVLNGLEFLNPSQECKDKVAPFLCLHFFGLCGDTGICLQPTSDQCVRIRDNTCYREWREAAMFNIELPDCSNLPLSAPSCENNGYNQDFNDINDINDTGKPWQHIYITWRQKVGTQGALAPPTLNSRGRAPQLFDSECLYVCCILFVFIIKCTY